jgi:rubrerythrin
MPFDTVDQILDFAIAQEQAAARFYTGLAEKMRQEHMKAVFQCFAQEERGHEAKLLAIK